MFKKITFALISLLVLGFGSSPSMGAAWDFPNVQSIPTGSTLIAVNEPNSFDIWSSWESHDSKGFFDGSGHLCPSGINETTCNPDNFTVTANSILSICKSEADQNCVESLRLAPSGSGFVTANVIRSVNDPIYSAPEQGAVPAGQISLWNAPGVPHKGGTENYSVLVKLKQVYNKSLGRFVATGLTANVTGFTARSNGESPSSSEILVNGVSKVATRHDAACIWADSQGCGLPEDFSEGLKIELSIRVSNEITGWFRGRLKDPVIAFEPYGDKSNRLVVSAEPVSVPRVSILATKENTPDFLVPVLSSTGGKNPLVPLFSGNAIKDFFSNEGERLFSVLDGMRAAAKDTAAGVSALWNFTTIEGQYGGNKCFQDKSKVLGIVTTNASAYKGDPPSYEGGYLNYKVAGLHFSPGGVDPNFGTYDLLIDSATARCLYGFTKAPVSATVTVVGTGDQNIATTVVSEKDGWLKLAAYGFTFSEKEIQVKLTQPFTKTITKFSGSTKSLSSKQRAEIKATVTKAKSNPKFICTGTYVKATSKATALARARATCNYAKSLDKNHSYYAQAKQTSASSYDAKVMISSK